MNIQLFTLITTALLSQITFANTDLDWGYSGHNAPEHWTKLDVKYHACSGANQSPINIEKTIDAELPPLAFNYSTTTNNIIQHHHTVQVNFNAGNFLTFDDKTFELKQFHLHTPSENTIHGQSYPMEMHLVHASETGELAVVAMMFKEGAENKNLSKIWNELPTKADQIFTLKDPNIATVFLPEKLDYYRFNGSLTTPPCSEGVHWLILKGIQQISTKQLNDLTRLIQQPNNRPVQSQNARLVIE